METSCDLDVLVVGAGLSGLTAAYRLQQRCASMRIAVLEAKDRIGGRTFTVPLQTSNGRELFDLGGQWISTDQSNILELLSDLKVKTFPQSGILGMTGNSPVTPLTLTSIVGTWYCRYELVMFIRQIEKMVNEVSLQDPISCHFAHELDSISVEALLWRYLSTSAARDIMRSITHVALGAEAREISALFFIAYYNGTRGFLNHLKSTKFGGRELQIQGGSEQVSQLLMDKIGKDIVHLNEPIVKIQQDGDQVYVTSQPNKLYRCRYLIVAIPPGEVNKIIFQPPLPVKHKRLLERFPVGHLTKFVITYSTAFWRGCLLDDVLWFQGMGNHSSNVIPFSAVYDSTTSLGGAALTGYLNSKTAVTWSEMDPEKRKQRILHNLSKFCGPQALNPLDYVEKNWCEEEYLGGCPIHALSTGVMPLFHLIRTPFQRIFWAGTETATFWCGYMDGAVQSGNRAAIEVLHKLNPEVLKATDYQFILNAVTHQPPLKHTLSFKNPFNNAWVAFVIIAATWIIALSTTAAKQNNHVS